MAIQPGTVQRTDLRQAARWSAEGTLTVKSVRQTLRLERNLRVLPAVPLPDLHPPRLEVRENLRATSKHVQFLEAEERSSPAGYSFGIGRFGARLIIRALSSCGAGLLLLLLLLFPRFRWGGFSSV